MERCGFTFKTREEKKMRRGQKTESVSHKKIEKPRRWGKSSKVRIQITNKIEGSFPRRRVGAERRRGSC